MTPPISLLNTAWATIFNNVKEQVPELSVQEVDDVVVPYMKSERNLNLMIQIQFKTLTKIAIVMAMIVSLLGCKSHNEAVKLNFNKNDFSILCLDGVEYWIRASGVGLTGFLAIKMDSVSLTPVRCKVK